MNDLSDYKEVNGNLVHPTAVVYWDRIKIGTGNIIYPYVCIGTDAQHMREPSDGVIEIGDNNVFREHTCVTMPTRFSKKTSIGNNCYFMTNSMVHHDCVVEDNVTMSNNCVIAGHVYVMKGSIIGLNCNVHQWQVIGSYSMLGMGTIVTPKNKIVPGKIYIGTPAEVLKDNVIGLQRNNISDEALKEELERYNNLIKEVHK